MSILGRLDKAYKNKIKHVETSTNESVNMEDKIDYKSQLKIPIILIVVGIFMNIGGKLVTVTLGLPIFLDTIGTMLVSFLSGYLPGITVAVLSNFFNMIFSETTIYYNPINILIAVLTVFTSRRIKKSWKSHIFYVLLFAFLGGVIGGVISLLVGTVEVTKYNEAIILFLEDKGLSFLASWFVASFLYDLIDKTISYFVVCMFFDLVPNSTYVKFTMTFWHQKPLKRSIIREWENSKKYKSTIKGKVIKVLLPSYFVLAFSSMLIYANLNYRYMLSDKKMEASNLAGIAAGAIDGDSINSYLRDLEQDDSYYETKEQLEFILKEYEDVEILSVYKFMSDGRHVVFDINSLGVTPKRVGSVETFDLNFIPYVNDFLNGNEVKPLLRDNSIIAYQPVFDSNGNCVCYVSIVLSIMDVLRSLLWLSIRFVCIIMGLFILLVIIDVSLSKYMLFYPIEAMSMVIDDFDYNDEYDRQNNLEKLKEVGIKTGDEIEGLYKAFVYATSENVTILEENKRKIELIDDVKKNLIYVVTKILDHKQNGKDERPKIRTEYMEIIMQKMFELGYYKEELTEGFIKDVIYCTPLYDIGKISVSEDILSKNEEELTKEEREEYESHTIIGKDILEDIVSTIPTARYLDEAKKLAIGHHEYWDGSGYPYGSKGEDIPLSARILSVVIYYDEKIMGHEDLDLNLMQAFIDVNSKSGTLFDPLVVDAFMKSEDEIVEMIKRNLD